MFGLGVLFNFSLLLLNAIAILNEQRFLARIGWAGHQFNSGFNDPNPSIKARIINLISAVRTLLRSKSDISQGVIGTLSPTELLYQSLPGFQIRTLLIFFMRLWS